MRNETIATLTKDCSREDCRIVTQGVRRPLIGSSIVYDRNGDVVSGPTSTEMYACKTCQKIWEVKVTPGSENVVTAL
jgi:hypothetical protein